MWIGVRLHHVCGEHEWLDGECSQCHGVSAQEEAKYAELFESLRRHTRNVAEQVVAKES